MKTPSTENKSTISIWFWPSIRIMIVIIMIVGAFLLGSRCGYNTMSHRGYDDRSRLGDSRGGYEHIAKHKGINMNHGQENDMMDMSMRDMGAMLAGKTGAELNRAFLEGMIPHHQGAVEMAKYLENSDKPELRQMGQDIIKAQTTEIEQMKKWMTEWGYTQTGTTANTGMTMSGMHMMPDGSMMHN